MNITDLLIKVESGGHSDGSDNKGHFTSVFYYFGTLSVKSNNGIRFDLPIGFIMVPNKEKIIDSVHLGDMRYSGHTDEYKLGQQYAKKLIAENNIDYEELKKQFTKKLSEQYQISEELKEYIKN